MTQFHPFHMVFMSPWPFISGNLLICAFFLFLLFFNKFSLKYFVIIFMVFLLCLFNWWRDVMRESTMQGYHTTYVFSNMRYGMLLFIVSEIFFFISFFWSFFHSSLSPTFELGGFWPPPSTLSINPFDVPLLNTVILLSSGITVTLSHHFTINKNNSLSCMYLFITIMLGVYFTFTQLFEYYQTDFYLSDSSFGSCFFVATGFHGFHVIVGTLLLFFASLRFLKNHFNFFHHIGLESSIWYWHFVDVVWLFLFLFIYWWVY
uniref:Cytochrome c oxidase subunit 3 n=1 Tax=Echiniscus testudo TaxID=399800 RepID=A0A348BR57_ECHTS|nr:cytochrome c oxidase subunit 3 [Echiniscus testudo]